MNAVIFKKVRGGKLIKHHGPSDQITQGQWMKQYTQRINKYGPFIIIQSSTNNLGETGAERCYTRTSINRNPRWFRLDLGIKFHLGNHFSRRNQCLL